VRGSGRAGLTHLLSEHRHTLAHVSVAAAIGLGAVLGLGLGIVVSLTADVPFAPEVGLALGALLGWLLHRRSVS
jgi:hypothetical protein